MTNDHYTAIMEQYESLIAKPRQPPLLYRLFRQFETHRIDEVSKLIEGSNLRVLEIGCGDGNFLYKIREKWQKITGVDVIENQIKQAKNRKFGIRSDFLKQDYGLKPMPFPSNSFDVMVSIATLQYLFNLDLFFTEVHRVLKKNGKVLIEIPNSAVFWKRLSFLFGHFPKTTEYQNGWNGGVIHYFTQENISSFLEKKGFTIEVITCSGIFASIRGIAPGLLGADLVIRARKI